MFQQKAKGFVISRTLSSDNRAASRNPRDRSIRVIAAVIRLVMMNFGLNTAIFSASCQAWMFLPASLVY